MKVRIVALMLMIVYMLTLSVNINATDVLSTVSTSNEAYVISKDNFAKAFSRASSKETVAMLMAEKNLQTAKFSVSNIAVDNDVLSCVINLSVGGKIVNLPISGRLAAGVRTQTELNCIIVEVPSTINGFTVRLFEIVNDSKDDNTLICNAVDSNKSLSGQPHMKIYIEDDRGVLYLLEHALPEALHKLNANDYSQADKYKDAIFWATDLVEHTVEMVPVTEELLSELGLTTNTRGLDEYSYWMPEYAYSDTFTVNGVTNKCTSLPYLKYMYSNLESSADTTWIVSFRIAEHNNYGGTTMYGYNPFYYNNLDLQVGCGDHTTFIRSYQQGRMYKDINASNQLVQKGETLTIGLLTYAGNAVHTAATLGTVLEVLEFLADGLPAEEEITLGNNNIILYADKVVGVREKLSFVRLEDCTDQPGAPEKGHYYTKHFVMKRYGSPETTTTVGAIMLDFEVWYGWDCYQTLSAFIPLGYTVYGS